MDNKNTALQQKGGLMHVQMASQSGNGPNPSVTIPRGPGVYIAGSGKNGLYRIGKCNSLFFQMYDLQKYLPPPLEVVAWLPDDQGQSKRHAYQLRRLFREKRSGDDLWFRLSAADLTQARAYLAEEKERLEREAESARKREARKLEQARQNAANAQVQAAKARGEDAMDDCVQLIRRLRMLADVVRWSLEQECRMARGTWPQQQVTDDCLKLVDRFLAAVGKFDAALSRSAMEIQLARMPKDDAACW